MRTLSAWIVGVGLCAASWATAQAVTHEYAFEIEDRGRVAFKLELPVQYAGDVVIRATWTGHRILAFKIEPPEGSPVLLRRSGPSPQRLAIEVDPPATAATEPLTYTLSIMGLPASGAGNGLLTIELPDHPEVAAEKEAALLPPPPPEPEPERWMVPVKRPATLSPDQVELLDAVESLQALVVSQDDWTVGADPCRWQSDVLQYLDRWRIDSLGSDLAPDVPTSRFFRELAATVAEIEALRTTDDPILVGPPPRSAARRQAWQRLRNEEVQILERRLDGLLKMLRDGYVPELEAQDWPTRFVSCMTACERQFEDRLLAGELDPPTSGLASTQWEPILSAAQALEAVSMLSADPELR